MGGFISFIWMGSWLQTPAWTRGPVGWRWGRPWLPAPPRPAPDSGTRAARSRPAGCRVRARRTERKAGRREPGPRGRPAPALLSGVAVGPRAARSSAGAQGEEPPGPAGPERGRAGGGPRGDRAGRGEAAGSSAVGAGSAEDQARRAAARMRVVYVLLSS